MRAPRNPTELSIKPNIVLVVEDDNAMRELLRVELEAEGFIVLTATNGAEAVSKARSRKPDVILMDVQMPKMDGIEATRVLKDDKDTRHIPVIMVTSVEREEGVIEGLEAGAIDYITKPFFLPELKARIGAVLRFVNLYNELIIIKEQIIKQNMSEMIRDIISLVKVSINESLDAISQHFNNLQRSQKYISQDDLILIENISYNVKSSVVNLDSIDSCTLKIFQTISAIVDKMH